MSDHLGVGAGRSGVAWPSATIPARVKKLSWDDAADNKVGYYYGILFYIFLTINQELSNLKLPNLFGLSNLIKTLVVK